MASYVPHKEYPEIDRKVDDLLAEMTLPEKVGQLVQMGTSIYADDPALAERYRQHVVDGRIGSFLAILGLDKLNNLQKIAVEESRLGIPLLFAYDVIHGYRTTTPIPLGETATWDPAAVKDAAAVAAREARADGIHWTFAPMVDIARDPRWGRIAEGAGEDTFLGCAMAAARVEGFQGDNIADPERVLTCAKHFAAYGAAEGGRDYNSVDISLRTFREVYLPPFLAAIKAGVGTFMCAFNDFNGTPCSGSSFLLSQVLREENDFKGFVVSDANSVREMIAHRFVPDNKEAGYRALTAGLDMDMNSAAYMDHLEELVAENRIDTDLVETSAKRILRLKFMLGLFDNPYTDKTRGKGIILCPENRARARAVARKSLVLLENRNSVLPLNKELNKIAVIGPLGDNRIDALGTWACSSHPEDVITLAEGIRAALPDAEVLCEQGCGFTDGIPGGTDKAVAAAAGADAVILAVGEHKSMSGEAHCRTDITLPAIQLELAEKVINANPATAVILFAGRSLAIPELAAISPALVMAWHPGTECGPAIADVLFGDCNFTGRLPVTFPHVSGQVPLYYNHLSTGRPPAEDSRWGAKYLDAPIDPLYPFGYGLSYTAFTYDNLRLSAPAVSTGGTLTVLVDVTNTGNTAGTETVQLYIRDDVSSAVRPVRELKGFRQVALDPGQQETVTFELQTDNLGFFNAEAQYTIEPGTFTVWAGPSSKEGPAASFELK